ncbi:MAG TPA: Cof-type HAD-IIB family hydrolase [Sphingomonas sp.]|nr:Cof-type HAD-IIB family hydrolase [Sphingomonas sp.]
MIDRPRLVVCDLDGTLVDSDKQLRPAELAAVKRLTAAGIGFAVISARPPSGVQPIVEALGLEGVQAAFNGGTLFRGDGSVVARETVDEDVVRGMFALVGDAAEPWVFAAGRWHACVPDGAHAIRERKSSHQEPIVTADFTPLFGDVDKLTFVSDDRDLLAGLCAKAQQRFGGRATVAQSQVYYLDVTPLAGNKGAGIRALARSRGFDLAETIAIGDQANDIAMLEAAGFGIAMGNAPDAVKAKADAVTASNDDDGVAQAIDTLILKQPA